jgi:hypothetical protein
LLAAPPHGEEWGRTATTRSSGKASNKL